MFKLHFKEYTLHNHHVFRIATGARNSSPSILTAIQFEEFVGYGEGAIPALYGETPESVKAFLSKIDLSGFKDPMDIEGIMTYVDSLAPGNPAAKASIDIALHDLKGKILNKTVAEVLGLPVMKNVSTSKTIGIDAPEEMSARALESAEFDFIKVKLGSENDREIIEAIRKVSNQPLYIDANQGWKTKEKALENIKWLADQNVVFIEQPMPKTMNSEMNWLKSRSPLPLVGDESIQRLSDVLDAEEFFHGINIKMIKSTGLKEGYKMAVMAKEKGMKVMLGCSTETSCSISAAFQLTALADWVDLDGNLLIKNNPYEGVHTLNGKISGNNKPGIGLINPEKFWNLDIN